jgi:large subunit ribosomal protein L5e
VTFFSKKRKKERLLKKKKQKMPFVKLVKNKAYFKRFQVQYRRRREGKTDFRARRQMVLQDKTKYGAPKYRLVVRFTNKDIIAQSVHAEVVGDKVLQAAYAHELPVFGLNHGLTNYAAAYSTGLLLARRTLTALKIADKFAGNQTTGEFKEPRDKKDDQGEGRFPFRAILDVGLARTTTGAKIFGVMKGVVDGGIAVPHKPNRFPGFNKAKGAFNSKILRERIFGGHVANWMKKVADKKKENPDQKVLEFSKFGAAVKAADLEGLYKKVHEAIRKDPTKRVPRKNNVAGRKNYGTKRLTAKERRANVEKKISALRKKLKA